RGHAVASAPGYCCLRRSGKLSSPTDAFRGRLVDDAPEQAQFFNRAHEFVKAQRLDDVGIDAQVIALGEVALLTRRGQHDDWYRAQPLVGAHGPQHLQPVNLGHLDVEENDGRVARLLTGVWATTQQVVERLCAVLYDNYFIG